MKLYRKPQISSTQIPHIAKSSIIPGISPLPFAAIAVASVAKTLMKDDRQPMHLSALQRCIE